MDIKKRYSLLNLQPIWFNTNKKLSKYHVVFPVIFCPTLKWTSLPTFQVNKPNIFRQDGKNKVQPHRDSHHWQAATKAPVHRAGGKALLSTAEFTGKEDHNHGGLYREEIMEDAHEKGTRNEEEEKDPQFRERKEKPAISEGGSENFPYLAFYSDTNPNPTFSNPRNPRPIYKKIKTNFFLL